MSQMDVTNTDWDFGDGTERKADSIKCKPPEK